MEERLLLLLLYALTYVEWISFYAVVLKEQLIKPTKKNFIIFLILLTLRIVGIVFWGHKYLLFDIVWIAFCCCFFSMTIMEALKKWVIFLAIVCVMEGSVNCVLRAFSLCMTNMEIVWAIECASVVIAIIWLYYLIIGRKLNKDFLVLPKRVGYLFTGVNIVLMLMMSYFSFVLSEVPKLKMVKAGSVIILMGGLSVFGMIIAVIYYFNGTAKYRLQNEISEKYNEQQREYFTRLLEKEQLTRQFRHDIINHLIVMQEMAGKEQSERLQEYIGELLQEIDNEHYKQYDVGNEVVNTILNYYLLPMRESCDVKVTGYMGELEKISQKDLCTIISNVIKNAVEAVQNVDDKNKEIVVDINCGEKYLSVKVENTMNGDIMIGENGLPQTSKSDKNSHSIGLLNTKTVVEKYNGTYEIILKTRTFITQIYLKK
ncbi:MAG: GHKL domain-containing protein [Lachnospiraceae bacterium]|nr:GHKL domain-containing protein [Lachnospiraceae bacterium]